FEEGWRGLSNLVTAAGFDQKDVEVERNVVLQEAALDKKNPLTIAGYSILRRLFPEDPLSQPVIGFTKTLRRIRLADVERYYALFYRPDNAGALAVGDGDAPRAAALIADTLGAWRGPRPTGRADGARQAEPQERDEKAHSPQSGPSFPPAPRIA